MLGIELASVSSGTHGKCPRGDVQGGGMNVLHPPATLPLSSNRLPLFRCIHHLTGNTEKDSDVSD